MFNQYQREYMRELSELPADQKCACGWYRKGQHPSCRRPEAEGLVKRNPQATAEEDQL